MDEVITILKENNLGKIIENVPLSKYTTYKVGGVARIIIFPKSVKDLIKIRTICKNTNVQYMVLGYGSNVLFSDKTYEGVIIKLDELNEVEVVNNNIIVGAGHSLMKLSVLAMRKSLTGLEFAAGIPGSVGGAVYMNAGAYKSDMGYIVTKVKVLTPDDKVITMVNRECKFQYRKSFFTTHKDYIILEVTLKLMKGEKSAIEKVMRERKERRLDSQPLEYPSAGSVFRNPDNNFAGKMIEELGLKGLTKGGAQISKKHANFIINIGGAKGQDVMDLIDLVKDAVRENYGIELHVEQEFINWE